MLPEGILAVKSVGTRFTANSVSTKPESKGTDGVGCGVEFPIFWIDCFQPNGTKRHTAFSARRQVEVDAFHAIAQKAGGIGDGRPGFAPKANPGYANISALCRIGRNKVKFVILAREVAS